MGVEGVLIAGHVAVVDDGFVRFDSQGHRLLHDAACCVFESYIPCYEVVPFDGCKDACIILSSSHQIYIFIYLLFKYINIYIVDRSKLTNGCCIRCIVFNFAQSAPVSGDHGLCGAISDEHDGPR